MAGTALGHATSVVLFTPSIPQVGNTDILWAAHTAGDKISCLAQTGLRHATLLLLLDKLSHITVPAKAHSSVQICTFANRGLKWLHGQYAPLTNIEMEWIEVSKGTLDPVNLHLRYSQLKIVGQVRPTRYLKGKPPGRHRVYIQA